MGRHGAIFGHSSLITEKVARFRNSRPALHTKKKGRRPGNGKAQGQRGTSAALGLPPPDEDQPCKGGIHPVATPQIAPLQGLSRFPHQTQACARASLSLGFHIFGTFGPHPPPSLGGPFGVPPFGVPPLGGPPVRVTRGHSRLKAELRTELRTAALQTVGSGW